MVLVVKICLPRQETGSIPGLIRSPGVGNGNPLHYSCLENSKDRGVWWVTVHEVTRSHTWWITHLKVKVSQSCLTLQPHGLYSPWNSPGQNTGVGSLSLLQGIFPTQGSNPGLLHCRQILYQMSHQGRPSIHMHIYLKVYIYNLYVNLTNKHTYIYYGYI